MNKPETFKDAVIYGRFSTDKQNKESANDQLRACREYCKDKRWPVKHEFKDEGISGGTSKRPGYQALLAFIESGQCDVVVVEESKRLWRALGEQAKTLDRWKNLDVHLVTLSGLDTRDENARMALMMMGAMAEQELKECRYRIRRGLKSRADEGKSTGGRVFGYNKPKSKGKPITVNREQAAVVRRIFKDYLAGLSTRSIAHALNRDRIPSPGASWDRTLMRRDGKWLQSGVRVILRNERYCGKVVWGAHEVLRVAGDSSKRRYVPNKNSIAHVRPDLRIIDDVTFRAAQRRAQESLKQHKAKAKRGGPALRHALSGLMRCGECGGAFVMSNKRSYSCATHRCGGAHACSVAERVRKDVLEAAVFGAISERLLSPEFLAAFSTWWEQVNKKQKAQPDTAKRLKEVQRRIANTIEAITDGELRNDKDLADTLRKLQDERDQLAAEQKRPTTNVISLLPRLQERYKALFKDLPAVAARDPARARALLQTLTGGFKMVPTKAGLVAEATLTGERLAAFAGVGSTGFAGGGT